MTAIAADQLRVFSSGGGQQSIAALVLSAQGRIDYPTHLFANVGDRAESRKTLEYVHNTAIPYAAEHGIEYHELRWRRRDGTPRDLWDDLVDETRRSVDIPVRMLSGAPGMRNCTSKYKRDVVNRWLTKHGATPDDPAVCAIGISVDEMSRARTDSGYPNQIRTEPLIDLGLSRQDCVNIIRNAGLPIPPSSSCFFCPFKRLDEFRRMKAEEPDEFARACELEVTLNRKRRMLGKDEVFLSGALVPLASAVGVGVQEALPFDTCDSGACFT